MGQLFNTNPGDWPEDFNLDNGEYFCKCSICESHFVGHKRRVICKQCAKPAQYPLQFYVTGERVLKVCQFGGDASLIHPDFKSAVVSSKPGVVEVWCLTEGYLATKECKSGDWLTMSPLYHVNVVTSADSLKDYIPVNPSIGALMYEKERLTLDLENALGHIQLLANKSSIQSDRISKLTADNSKLRRAVEYFCERLQNTASWASHDEVVRLRAIEDDRLDKIGALAKVGDVVFQYIDRMTDVDDTDTAEKILNEFVTAVEPALHEVTEIARENRRRSRPEPRDKRSRPAFLSSEVLDAVCTSSHAHLEEIANNAKASTTKSESKHD